MKVIFLLAYRNVLGAGLRTWLNVIALSIGIVLVIWMQGYIEGMMKFMISSKIDFEIGGGQFIHKEYDKSDPLTINDSRGTPHLSVLNLIEEKVATPLLLVNGTFYPSGRSQTATFRGIEHDQSVLKIPSSEIVKNLDYIPAMIGSNMAKSSGLKVGDTVTIRWRDIEGTFDAADIEIVHIMNISSITLDRGQIWLNLSDLRKMMDSDSATTIVVTSKGYKAAGADSSDFLYSSQEKLLEDDLRAIEGQMGMAYIFYFIFMAMGLLAIFDTQVLALFKRRKEVGTLMSIGLNKTEIVTLFTIEGTIQGILAILVGAIWGLPLFIFSSTVGIQMPEFVAEMGLPIGDSMYTYFSFGMVSTILGVLLFSIVVVSYWPTRIMSNTKITDALKGKA